MMSPRAPGDTESDEWEAGFSLGEMLVALALVALMLALTPGAIRLATSASSAYSGLERAAAFDSAERVVRRALEAALPPAARGDDATFNGSSTALTFVAPPPAGRDGGGFQVYRLALRDTGRRADVVVSLSPVGASNAAESELVIAEDVASLDIRYFGTPAEGGRAGWQTGWSGRPNLPRLVDVVIAYGAANRPSDVIVVAPRLATER